MRLRRPRPVPPQAAHGVRFGSLTASMAATKPRILTGDTPTGSLHLGHWVGSVRRRVELQDSHDCYFIIANMHAFTTRADKPAEIRRDSLEIVRDYLAMGIDPAKSVIFLQSEVPAIAELCFLFAMLLPFNRVMRNPTLKTELELKGLGETRSGRRACLSARTRCRTSSSRARWPGASTRCTAR